MLKIKIVLFIVLAVFGSTNAFSEGANRAEMDRTLEAEKYKFEYLKEKNRMSAEYWESVEKMHKAKKRAEDAKNGKPEQKESNDTADNRGGSQGRPSWQRGNPEYDKVKQEKANDKAYIISISGRKNNLSAEIHWAGASATVQKGDPIIGGDWTVTNITRSAVEISNGRLAKVLTNAKVNISSLLD